MANISPAPVTAAASADAVTSQPAVPKMSFASVAARAATPKLNKPASTVPQADNRPLLDHAEGAGKASRLANKDATDGLQQSVAAMNINGGPGPIIASADIDAEPSEPIIMALQNDDEKTHLSFVSNPTVSTDVRSVVSGAAFNMDEKESIRPDDSASVKAADESDSMSGQGSGGPQSQVASEAGKDGFRDQFQEVSSAKKALPLTTTLVGRVPDDAGRTVIPTAIEFQPERPDPKLTDALENPKDRLFLLQLEQQVIAFIADPKQEALALPPQNSFCRLLAHRLGDYYMLSHTADTSMGNVTLRKTETTRLPPSLKELSSPTTPDSTAPQHQHQPALKIMRRKTGTYGKDNGDDAAASSGIQSQTGSDTGASGTDLQRSPSKGAKANMTREEREAHYQATRDRIFGDMEEAKPSTETSTAASRASSATGGKAKKQKNRPKNDDFEPRSMFMNMGYQQQQQQQAGYAYPDRSQQGMYGFPPVAPNMPPQNMAAGYGDGSMMHNPHFAPPQHSHQMIPQPMSMGGGMQGYGQPNVPPQPMYNGGYGYQPQGQNMAPMPMQQQQQQYYSGSDQGSPYSNNMMGVPMMMNPSQQGYAQGYQGWNQGVPMPYSPQDQSGYFPQPTPNGYPGGIVYQGAPKPIDGTTPPGGRFSSAEYSMPSPHAQQPQQQQGQWNQWQGPSQYSQYPNNQMSWQNSQSGMQGPPMHANAAMQPQKMNNYQNQSPNSGKPGKKGGKGKGTASELGKYDTSSLPPKPPAPLQNDQGI